MKLGKAFSDSLVVGQKASARFIKTESASWWLGAGRPLLFTTIMIAAFFVLLVRLFHLTVVDGHKFRSLADGNRTRELVRHAPRGLLLDRTGKPLVANIAEYRLHRPCEEGAKGVSCISRVTRQEGETLDKQGLPAGSFIEIDYLRQYLFGESLAHVLGYTGELSEEELDNDYFSLRNYRRGDKVGRMGAEEVFEEKLRGRDGRELVEIDAQGKTLRTLGRDEEIAGENIELSLDATLSQVVAAAFQEIGGLASPDPAPQGAVVVTKPGTGEVLALHSSPSFNPNKFSLGMSQAEFDAMMSDPGQPLFDRAIGGTYPPGSTFKVVTALAGLSENAVMENTTVEDTGVITIGPFTFPNWYFTQYGKTEGIVNLVRAIQRSNDIFFYKVGEWLGITKLAKWAARVGIGKPLGIELSGEASGLFPDPSWKNQKFTTAEDRAARNNEWYLGDTYHVSIGQGYLLTTPLQVNAWTNLIANNGRLCRPTIEKARSEKREARSGCKDLGIKKETIDLITEGMKKACEPGGTGWPLFNFNIKYQISNIKNEESASTPSAGLVTKRIPVACKTGTAEFGDPQDKTHAWFTVFAPVPVSDSGNQTVNADQNVLSGEPEISVTVLVEGGGEGSSVAAPIAKKILESWFSR